MNRGEKPILVTGATGQQGGAVARHLLAQGWHVRALTRNASQERAMTLARAGAEVVEGNLNDPGSLEAALEGAYGVFSVQAPLNAPNVDEGYGAAQEVQQGTRLGELARAAEVEHFVYSSAGGADRESPLPHVMTKWQVEQHLRALDLPLTVIYPTFFMDNFFWTREEISAGRLTFALKPQTRLQMIAVEDIGAFTALIFAEPDEYLGKAVELAGDELTMPQAAAVFEEIVGTPVEFVQQPIEQLASFSPEMAHVMQEFDRKKNQADIADLRKRLPSLMTLERWLVSTGWGAA